MVLGCHPLVFKLIATFRDVMPLTMAQEADVFPVGAGRRSTSCVFGVTLRVSNGVVRMIADGARISGDVPDQ